MVGDALYIALGECVGTLSFLCTIFLKILLLQVVAMDDWKVETFNNGTRLKYEWYVYSDLICALLSSFQYLSTSYLAISTVLLVTQYEPFSIISLSVSLSLPSILSCLAGMLSFVRPAPRSTSLELKWCKTYPCCEMVH